MQLLEITHSLRCRLVQIKSMTTDKSAVHIIKVGVRVMAKNDNPTIPGHHKSGIYQVETYTAENRTIIEVLKELILQAKKSDGVCRML